MPSRVAAPRMRCVRQCVRGKADGPTSGNIRAEEAAATAWPSRDRMDTFCELLVSALAVFTALAIILSWRL